MYFTRSKDLCFGCFLVVLSAVVLSGTLPAQTTATVTQTVAKRNTIGVLTATPMSGLQTGSAVTFGYRLHTAGAPAPTADTVQFLDGGVSFGTAQAIGSVAATNLLPYSQVDTSHGWMTTGTAPTVTPSHTNGPDGSTTSATEVVFPSTSGGSSRVALAVPGTAYAGQSVTLSVWAQSAVATTLTMGLTDSPAGGATGSATCAVGSTWTRCTLTLAFPAGAGTGFAVSLGSAGQPAQTIELWGAQVEQATTAGGYVSTIGTARPTGAAAGGASFPYSGFHAGSHTVTVSFPGDGNYVGSTSNAVTFTVAKSTPTLTLSTSPSGTSAYGTATTLSAALAGTTFLPTGTVQFFDGGTSLGTGTVDGSGNVSVILSGAGGLAAGTHSITAVYSGDGDNNGLTSTATTYTVTKAHSTVTTTLSSTLNPSTYGDSVTFTVVVSSSAGAIPTGTVAITDGGAALGTVTLDGSGHGTLTTSALTAGSHTIAVAYSGDGNYN